MGLQNQPTMATNEHHAVTLSTYFWDSPEHVGSHPVVHVAAIQDCTVKSITYHYTWWHGDLS